MTDIHPAPTGSAGVEIATDTRAALMLVEWDVLLYVLRRASPMLGMYGGNEGADAVKMVRMLRDDTLLRRVANEIFALTIKRKVADAQRAALDDAVKASDRAYYDGIETLAKSL